MAQWISRTHSINLRTMTCHVACVALAKSYESERQIIDREGDCNLWFFSFFRHQHVSAYVQLKKDSHVQQKDDRVERLLNNTMWPIKSSHCAVDASFSPEYHVLLSLQWLGSSSIGSVGNTVLQRRRSQSSPLDLCLLENEEGSVGHIRSFLSIQMQIDQHKRLIASLVLRDIQTSENSHLFHKSIKKYTTQRFSFSPMFRMFQSECYAG